MPERAITDLGGIEAGAIDTTEHEPTLTERRIDAMMMLMRAKPRAFWGSDENRRTIESLTPEFYEGSAYYERWVVAMRALMIEKGILTEEEISAKLDEVRKRHLGGDAG
jgi:nitrile hydratase subunit beta